MQNLNHVHGEPAHGFAGAGQRLGAGCAGETGGGQPREAGRESREAAGLVPFKTSPIENGFPSVGHTKTINFSKQCQAEKRVKRLKANVWAAGHLHNLPKPGHRPTQAWFVTLTYRLVDGWRPNHIAEAMDAYRRWCKRENVPCEYLFVAELQSRGAVHYHMLVWLPRGKRMPMWDKETRASKRQVAPFWNHGMTNTQKAKAGVGYLMKYLSKLGEFTIFPEGIRLYGMGGLTPEARQIRYWQNLPQWIKNDHGVGDITRMGRHYVETLTGEVLPAMWKREFCPGGVVVTMLRPMTEKLYDHGAFCTFNPDAKND